MAFLTLFRVATGDNWNGIMKDTLRDKCDSSPDCVKNCCLYPFVAPIFFVVFVLMAQFVLVNVVVAVLMKHLEESHKLHPDEGSDERTESTDTSEDSLDFSSGDESFTVTSEEISAWVKENLRVDLEKSYESPGQENEEEEAEFARLLRMEDEYDMEVEIERQLAQEEEEMAEMQENIANQKLAQQTAKDVNETVKAKFNSSKYFHKPLNKMSSLPSNFTFRGQREMMEQLPKDKASSPVTPGLPDIRVDNMNIPRININGVEGESSTSHIPSFTHEEDLYNPNLKRPSPDEPVDKVSITDLRQKLTNSSVGGARPRSSKPDTPQTGKKQTDKKVTSEAPLAKSYEGEEDVSGSESITPGPNSPLLQDEGSPATRRAVRRSRWSGSREVSGGGGYKASLDDSLTQTLMASFDNVPELGGRVDMDSTSCSVCSSEDVSNASCLSSGPSPGATTASGPSTLKDTTQVHSPLPELPPPPPPPTFADNDDDEDATLASSSDSFTLDGGPPEVPSLDSSPGSEGMTGLPVAASPNTSSATPVSSSSAKDVVDNLVNIAVCSSKSPFNCIPHSETSEPSPTSVSAPISVSHSSSYSEIVNSAKSFSSLCEFRTGGIVPFMPQCHDKKHKDEQHSQMKVPPLKTESKQVCSPRCESNQLWSPRNVHGQQWRLEGEGKQVWGGPGERNQSHSTPTIGLQLGDSRPQSRQQRPKCYSRTRSRSRSSKPES